MTRKLIVKTRDFTLINDENEETIGTLRFPNWYIATVNTYALLKINNCQTVIKKTNYLDSKYVIQNNDSTVGVIAPGWFGRWKIKLQDKTGQYRKFKIYPEDGGFVVYDDLGCLTFSLHPPVQKRFSRDYTIEKYRAIDNMDIDYLSLVVAFLVGEGGGGGIGGDGFGRGHARGRVVVAAGGRGRVVGAGGAGGGGGGACGACGC